MSQERTETAPDASRWVDQFGDALYRYARGHVEDRQTAEDLVQETFLAALEAFDHFQSRSSLLTWLIAILRRKVADHHRRETVRRKVRRTIDADTVRDEFFDRRGHWKQPLTELPNNPSAELEKREFWRAFDGCLAELPLNLADPFRLREVEGCDAADVCLALEISRANLSVRLHRARLLLRRCLELKWLKT